MADWNIKERRGDIQGSNHNYIFSLIMFVQYQMKMNLILKLFYFLLQLRFPTLSSTCLILRAFISGLL